MKLSEKIENLKRRTADYLNGMSEKLSLPTKKRIFIFIGIAMSCICLAMMVEPFRNKTSRHDLIPDESKVPVVIVPPATQEPLISAEEFTMLEEFKHMMDSMIIYDPNSYKEILNGREGLMDSINFLMKLYR